MTCLLAIFIKLIQKEKIILSKILHITKKVGQQYSQHYWSNMLSCVEVAEPVYHLPFPHEPFPEKVNLGKCLQILNIQSYTPLKCIFRNRAIKGKHSIISSLPFTMFKNVQPISYLNHKQQLYILGADLKKKKRSAQRGGVHIIESFIENLLITCSIVELC